MKSKSLKNFDAAREDNKELPQVTSNIKLPGRTLTVRPGPRSYKDRVVEGNAAALAERMVISSDEESGLRRAKRSCRRPAVIEASDTEASVGDEDSNTEVEVAEEEGEEKRRGPPWTIGDFLDLAIKAKKKKEAELERQLRTPERDSPVSASLPPKAKTPGQSSKKEALPQEERQEDSATEEEAPKRGRGRPVTTGDYACLKERQAKEAELRRQKYLRDLERDLLDPVPPKKRAWKACLKQEEKDVEELKECPTADIIAEALEESVAIFKAANCSAGLKGSFVRRLYRSAARLRATTMVLSDRVWQTLPTEPAKAQDHTAQLQKEIEDLRLQICNLKSEKAALQDPLAVPGPSTGMDVDPVRETRAIPGCRGESMDIDFDSELPPLPFTHQQREQEGTAKSERARKLPRSRPPAQPTRQEAPVENPPTVLRPRLQGKQVPLSVYPAGLPVERRGAYDEVSRQIDSLLSERQRLMTNGPIDVPSPASQGPLSSPRTTVPTAKPPTVPEGGEPKGGKKKGKKTAKTPPNTKSSGEPARQKAAAGGSKNRSARKKPTHQAPPKHVAVEAPPPSKVQAGEVWTEVVGRQKRRAAAGAAKEPAKPSGTPKVAPAAKKGALTKKGAAPEAKKASKRRRRAPRTAAISLQCPEGGYADAMRSVKANISLDELGIGVPHMRKGVTGAFILEIAGEDCGSKADALAAKMSQVLAGKEGVKVTRPQKKADLRLRDVDETVAEAEVASAVAAIGGCGADDIKVGSIRRFPNRMGTVWVQTPVAVANKVAAAGKVRLGWCLARAELLDVRPLQCYRCLERGHVQANCPGGPDRTGHCFRCGTPGHVARECTAPVRCPICADLGRKSDHKVESKQCTPPKRKPVKGAVNKAPISKSARPAAAPAKDDEKKGAAAQTAPSSRRKKQSFSSSKKRKISEVTASQSDRDSEIVEPPREQRVSRRATSAAARRRAELVPKQAVSQPLEDTAPPGTTEKEALGQPVSQVPMDTAVPEEKKLEEPMVIANNG